ncbi:MAG: cupin domain-containing protein [Oligoflexia bacterium]|nr:cupin domain-containing protein [Oligoflexia bacterium]
MSDLKLNCVDLSKTYLQLKPTGKAQAWDAGKFWESAKTKGFESPFGYLVAQYEFKETWSQWECHPNGDELLIAIDGSMELVLENDGSQEVVSLSAPNSFLIPAGTWHTANVKEPCRIIGISAGEGTQTRAK